MTTEFKEGDYVELVSMLEDPCLIEAGDRGFIRGLYKWRDNSVQYHIAWESGRTLSAVCPGDVLKLVITQAGPSRATAGVGVAAFHMGAAPRALRALGWGAIDWHPHYFWEVKKERGILADSPSTLRCYSKGLPV